MKHGFSLVELSIVLVILGLLTGGILAGQSLIRASELRAVSTEYQRYAAAFNTFRDKYFAVPGDFNGATRFWGDDNAACPDAAVPNGTPGTCNGNGDGNVQGAGAINATGEMFQFWKQLALAGLIEGTYTGLSGSAGILHTVPGTNSPQSKLSNAGWGYYNSGNYPGDANFYALNYGNEYIFGAATTANPAAAILRPEEAWNIDTKMDDGKPAQGKVIAGYWNNLCAAADDGTHANNDLVASYKLSNNAISCSLFFINQL